MSAEETRLQRRHVLLGYVRLAFGVAVVVLLLSRRVYFVAPLIAFAFAARAHERVLRRLAETRRALTFYAHALARVEGRWSELPLRQTRRDLSQSLFASDLDLFGPESLFHVLCEARTTLGEDTLAGWLLTPAAVDEVLARHQAITDLRPRLLLREALARARGPATPAFDVAHLAAWGETQGPAFPGFIRWLAPLLVVLTVVSAWQSLVMHSMLPILIMLIVDSLPTFLLRKRYAPLFAELGNVHRQLQTAEALVRAWEGERFSAPRLAQLQEALISDAHTASLALARLAALSTWTEARSNYLVRILDTPLLYSVQLASTLDRWRRTHGPHLRTWLQTLGEAEALLSLAAYSFDHPKDVFPTFATPEEPCFRAAQITHPLLPSGAGVRNDVSLDSKTRLLLISGSNMSGKSTLLRSVGINAVLAFAGAPVRAQSLALSPLTLAASIHVSDSLQSGQSRFYAEILRLRAITEAARNTPPVLFLLDELLAGTNSSDRLAGAEALVRELLRLCAFGLLSTHDLALTALSVENAAHIRNVHFEDEFIDGSLHFDYTLRDGIVQHGNGLALMRLVGLKVD